MKNLFLLFVTVLLKVPRVESNASLVIFSFPRLVFGHFHDALVKSRDVIGGYGGVVEVLSYKITVYPDTLNTTLVNGTSQDRTRSFCVISFKTTQEAKSWLGVDRLVNQVDTWSYNTEVNVIIAETALHRHHPFSLYMKAHLIALLEPKQDTDFSSVFVPEVTKIFASYGGNGDVKATLGWERIIGETWPPRVTDWLFYGPMNNMNDVKTFLKSDDVVNIVTDFPDELKSIQFYGMDSFFSTGSGLPSFRSTIVIYMWICILVWIMSM